jgi:hypothetical protein
MKAQFPYRNKGENNDNDDDDDDNEDDDNCFGGQNSLWDGQNLVVCW